MKKERCSIKNCPDKFYAKKLCKIHYDKKRIRGIVEPKCLFCKKKVPKYRSKYCSDKCSKLFWEKLFEGAYKYAKDMAIKKALKDFKG